MVAIRVAAHLFEALARGFGEVGVQTKADRHKSLSSLQELVLVWQEECRVQIHRRSDTGGWDVQDYRAGQVATLSVCDAKLEVDALYRSLGDASDP